MTRRTPTLLVLIAASGLVACGGDNLFSRTGLTTTEPAEILEAIFWEVETRAGERVDLIEDGALFSLTLDANDDTFDSSFRYRDIDLDVSGTFEVEGNRLIFSDDPFDDDEIVTERAFDFRREGDALLLSDSEVVWDIDGDGTDEVVTMDLRLAPVD